MLFPGMRLGWVVGPKKIIERFALMKQSVDLCSPSFNQLIIARFFNEGLMRQTIAKAVALYRQKNNIMLNALEKNMPSYVQWSKPKGGMFLWLTLPAAVNAKELIPLAVEKNVIFVTGRPFHCNGSGQNTLRLNYSFPPLEQIDKGIALLAEAITTFCNIQLPLK